METKNVQQTLRSSVPHRVHRFARVLTESTHAVYLVGGAVRNLLIGRPPEDWDIATNATPQQVQKLYRRTIPTGIHHGTITVLFAGERFEVTTFRTESTYSDSRRPDSVYFADSIDEDLSRRDFTINAIAFDLSSGTLHDPHGGCRDLSARQLRTVGSAHERFNEDGLRLFRGCRLVAELGLTVDQQTVQAMRDSLPTANLVASERICEELRRLLGARAPSPGLHLLDRTGLIGLCFGKLAVSASSIYFDEDTLIERYRCIDAVPVDVAHRLAMLMASFTIAKSDTASSADQTRKVLQRLRFPNSIVVRVGKAIDSLAFPLTADSSDADIRRLLSSIGRSAAEDAIAVRKIIKIIDVKLANRVRAQAEAPHPLSIPELLVDGKNLQEELRLKPGPVIGRLLNALLQEVLEDPSANHRSALLDSAKALLQLAPADWPDFESNEHESDSAKSM